ncbi:MAG TPA: HD domain-containing protein [Polyangia bacterium]|jgi:poly(A) polymerase
MPIDHEMPGASAVTPTLVADRAQSDPTLLFQLAREVAERERVPAPDVTAAVAAAPLPAKLAGAAIHAELTALLMAPGAPLALQWLRDSGLLRRVLPEVDATVDLSQEAGRRHKDVWEHTKQVVIQAPARVPVRWAALLHDVGKVRTRAIGPGGKVHFHGHAELGARQFDDIARRLQFERPLKQEVRFLILHHLRANQYLPSWTDSAVRRFDRELQPWLEDLLDLSRADITSRRPGRRQEALRQIDELWQRIVALREIDARLPPLPSGLGDAIMTRFALPPSRRVGELRQLCEDAIERGELEERQDADYYLDYLAKVVSAPA